MICGLKMSDNLEKSTTLDTLKKLYIPTFLDTYKFWLPSVEVCVPTSLCIQMLMT